ncbi:MAG: cell division protein FtsA [Dehalococcoidales bacterium]|nr:cell division protein FtsA [Dehalococcoidales bacterium]
MKRTRISAIDVGTTKVCSVMGDIDEKNNVRILGVGVAPCQGLTKGMVTNLNEARESIREAVRRAERTAGYKMESACVGVTGRHVSSINNKGAVAISRNDRLVRPEDLKRVIEVSRSVEVPTDQKVLHVIPRAYTVDGQNGVKNPVGMHGFRLDVETHIITAAATSVQNLTKCIRGIGIEIDDLILEPLAAAEAVLEPEEKLDGVMMADIGGSTTDIAVFKDNSVCFTSVLPIGGYQISRDISIGLGLSFEAAEELKKKFGDVTPWHGEEPAEDKPITYSTHSISSRDLSEIIRARVEELVRLIVMELPEKDYAHFIPSGLVLTGGGANLGGLAELSHDIVRFPVRIGIPPALPGVSDALCDPAYATSLGLLLWRSRNADTQTPKAKGGLRGFVSPVLRLFR